MFRGFYDFEPFDSSFNVESLPTPLHTPSAEVSGFDLEFNDFDNVNFSFLDQNEDPYFDSIFQQIITSPQKPNPLSQKIKKSISPRIEKQNSQKPENRSSTVLTTFKPFESPLAGQKFVDTVRLILPNENSNFV
jgi:hypothetical protein